LDNTHKRYMTEALTLARRGTGHVSPNPLVGCVLVKDDQIIGRGWHEQFGGPHAEINALRDAGTKAIGATAYVTLEPCAHQGKTPPCVEALIEANISTVVIAARDPNPEAGGGVERLREAGIEVLLGIETAAAEYQNRAFFHQIQNKRPWVIGKTATSLDGRIATRTGNSQWITGPAARRRSHDLRQEVDALVVGAETLRHDNPALTVRERWDEGLASLEPAHPLRIIVSSSGILPPDFHALDGSLPGKSLVATTDQMPANRESQLVDAGTEVLRLPSNSVGQIQIQAFLDALAPRCQSMVVEGGAQLMGAFVDAGLIDEVWAFIAPKWIGGASAPASVSGLGADRLDDVLTLISVEIESLTPDVLMRGLVDRTSSFKKKV